MTTERLIWAAGAEGNELVVLAARLRDIHVQDYESTEMYRLVNDSGVNISGPLSDSVQPATSFIGLGSEPAAIKFRKLLRSAIENS